ncbi:hypothetical protein T552_02187 [Pneumocystis carinii B80]|uniref:RED-like N-terminal domain-containing protein n=1 Tax=Pneumocystis carinii (strain B80) TaxID=1408658 RepID=A0A0W4ZH92_PNEC8|nr:hypothetical protein T552_02187 [Pneumocystis carinii B80]KTW27748.1 hypothetical protein T552_02187 [Pneumocystis carinii B80]
MNQDDFRKLLATPQQPRQTTSRPSFFRPISKDYRQTFIEKTTKKSSDKSTHGNHWTGKKAVKNEGSNSKASSLLPEGYRNRAKELQREDTEDRRTYSMQENMLSNLKEAVKKGEISHQDYLSQTQRLGGDFENSCLVRGLDRVLLERVRRGEEIGISEPTTIQTDLTKTDETKDEALDLDKIYIEGLSKKKDSEENIPKRKNRDELLSILKKQKTQDPVKEQSKFKPIGVREKDHKKKKSLKKKEDLSSEKKLSNQDQDQDQDQKNEKTTILEKTTPIENSPQKIQETLNDESNDIFDDVGVYDPFESMNFQTDQEQSNQNPVQYNTNNTHIPKRNYFHTSTSLEDDDIVQAGSLTRESVLKNDAQLVTALKKAATLEHLDNHEENSLIKKKSINVGFGLWLDDTCNDIDINDDPFDDDDNFPAKSKRKSKLTDIKRSKGNKAT